MLRTGLEPLASRMLSEHSTIWAMDVSSTVAYLGLLWSKKCTNFSCPDSHSQIVTGPHHNIYFDGDIPKSSNNVECSKRKNFKKCKSFVKSKKLISPKIFHIQTSRQKQANYGPNLFTIAQSKLEK